MNDAAPKYLAGFLAAVGANGSAAPVPSLPAPPALDARPPEAPPAVARPARSLEERIKHELHPLDAFPRLLACATANQPPGAEDQFRFRWFGLFYQGPRQDSFVLRVRLPGGRLRAFQLAGLAEITQALAAGGVVCNAQGGVDIPGVPVRAAAEILRRVEEIGLRTLLSGGDCVQAVRGGEHEGLTEPSRPPTTYPLIRELEQALILNRQLSDLPHGCEIFVLGADEAPMPSKTSRPEAIVFQADAGDPTGFLLAVPGVGALGVTLAAAQVVPGCLELLGRWAQCGDRTDRQRSGLADFFVGVGGENLRARLAQTVGLLSTPCQQSSAPTQITPTGIEVPDGRLLSGDLMRLAEVARAYGAGEIRLASGHLFIADPPDKTAAEQALRNALIGT